MHLSLQNWKWAEDAHREGSQGKRSWNPFPTKLSLETHLIFPPSPCNITSLPEQIVPLCIKSDSTYIHLRWKLAKTGRVERLMGDSTGKVKYVKQKMKILNTKENAKSRIITNKWKQSWIKNCRVFEAAREQETSNRLSQVQLSYFSFTYCTKNK